MKPHLNENGELCRCGFGKFQDPYASQPIQRTAGAKLDWLRDREDKFFKTEEGQLAFKWLEQKVEGNEKLDPLAPWIWREIKKGRIQPRELNAYPDFLPHLADWFASNSPTRRGVDVMQLTYEDVIAKMAEWDKELASKMDQAKTEGGTVVAKLDDGWTIRQITNADEAEAEGDAMGHCVGGYGSRIEKGDKLIYSLRDPKNQPHGTIEIDPVWAGYEEDWVDGKYTGDEEYDPSAVETHKRNRAILKDLHKDIQAINFIARDWRIIKAYKDTGASNQEFGKFLTDLCEANKFLEYNTVVQIVRAFLEGRSPKDLLDETHANHLTKLSPDGGNVIQIQGKENKMLVPKYREMVGEWLISMDHPPGYERTIQEVWLPAPNDIQNLDIWVDPENAYDRYGTDLYDYHSEYEHEKVTPTRNWDDYFPENQEHGYLHDPDGDGYCVNYDRDSIGRDNWESIIADAFNSQERGFYPADKLIELVKKANEFTPKRLMRQDRSYYDDFMAEVNDYIKEYLYPEFESRYYDSDSYLSEAQQWARIPEFRYADELLGHNFIDPNEPDPAEPNLNQNKLFGPIAPTEDQERDVQRRIEMREREGIEVPGETEGEQIRNVWNETATEQWENNKPENIVPWQDPENYDNQLGRFGKRFLKWFRRKANILDAVSDQLDPTVWDDASSPNPMLRPEINSWVTNFIIEALNHNGYTHMEDWLELIVTGSLTTYQYSPASDFDVSLFVKADKFPEWSRAEMIAIMMDECDGIPVPGTGHPLQCYVVAEGFEKTDLYKPGLRSAYDLSTDTWIVPPEKERSRNVVKEMNETYTVALENADKMEGLIRYEPFKAVQYYNQLHRRRKYDMEQGKGDFSPSNISYKMIEERGLIDQIHGIMKQYNID